MAEDTSKKFNGRILEVLREELSLEGSEVAAHLKLSYDEYAALENGTIEPPFGLVQKLATYFRVEPFNFYRQTLPKTKKRAAFRSSLGTYRGEPGPVLDAIRYCESVQKLLLSVVDYRFSWKSQNPKRLTIQDNAEEESAYWRDALEISDNDQLNITQKNQFFTYVRSKVEAKGISVLVRSLEDKNLKGMAYGTTESIPIILINSYKQQKASRTFTLVHEFGHVLMAMDDVSNPYNPKGAVERFCNKFAAALLMPRKLVFQLLGGRSETAINNATVKWLSNKLNVSMEAVVIRLEECRIVARGFWEEWKAQFSGFLPSEESEGGGGASEEGPDQGLVKLASFGFLFARHVPSGYREKGLSGSAVFKASRLKPAYFSALQDAALERMAEVEAYGAR